MILDSTYPKNPVFISGLNVYPTSPPSYLVLEVLIQNGEFYININMQKVESE